MREKVIVCSIKRVSDGKYFDLMADGSYKSRCPVIQSRCMIRYAWFYGGYKAALLSGFVPHLIISPTDGKKYRVKKVKTVTLTYS